ncbi:MAG: MobC family plasmid mobilization relaxosome protein [Clostridia bacterium]|jgi:hypothetical protein
MKKDERITIRVTKKEKERLIRKSKNAEMSLSEYLIDQGLDKDIVRIEGLDEFITELRRIGNNINQLTHLANSRAIYTVDLSNTKHELNMIWNKLNKLGGNSL